ncbi:MAG: hypothetical protein OFPI_07790 [Osedax symbiont Rs2]|nr:MAG: hypothetical protein OFPI_07790 [Osedax symbiont Rs2]
MNDQAHGLFKIEFNDNLLILDVTGPFNDEHVRDLGCRLQEVLTNVHGPWMQVTFLHQDCLFTPQAEQEMAHVVKLRIQRGLCAIAFVFVNKVGRIVIEAQIIRIFQEFHITPGFFTDSDTAITWVKAQLALQQP